MSAGYVCAKSFTRIRKIDFLIYEVGKFAYHFNLVIQCVSTLFHGHTPLLTSVDFASQLCNTLFIEPMSERVQRSTGTHFKVHWKTREHSSKNILSPCVTSREPNNVLTPTISFATARFKRGFSSPSVSKNAHFLSLPLHMHSMNRKREDRNRMFPRLYDTHISKASFMLKCVHCAFYK